MWADSTEQMSGENIDVAFLSNDYTNVIEGFSSTWAGLWKDAINDFKVAYDSIKKASFADVKLRLQNWANAVAEDLKDAWQAIVSGEVLKNIVDFLTDQHQRIMNIYNWSNSGQPGMEYKAGQELGNLLVDLLNLLWAWKATHLLQKFLRAFNQWGRQTASIDEERLKVEWNRESRTNDVFNV